jgi:hypothetical protein
MRNTLQRHAEMAITLTATNIPESRTRVVVRMFASLVHACGAFLLFVANAEHKLFRHSAK